MPKKADVKRIGFTITAGKLYEYSDLYTVAASSREAERARVAAGWTTVRVDKESYRRLKQMASKLDVLLNPSRHRPDPVPLVQLFETLSRATFAPALTDDEVGQVVIGGLTTIIEKAVAKKRPAKVRPKNYPPGRMGKR